MAILTFDQRIPFEWSPSLGADQWISRLDLWINRFPEDYSVYSSGRHKPGVHVYWIEAGFRIAPDFYLNYYRQRIFPPEGARPVGIWVDSPVHANLKGEALIVTELEQFPELIELAPLEESLDLLNQQLENLTNTLGP